MAECGFSSGFSNGFFICTPAPTEVCGFSSGFSNGFFICTPAPPEPEPEPTPEPIPPKPTPQPAAVGGFPSDFSLSLGAGPGIPLGVVSGPMRRSTRKPAKYITVKFKLNEDTYSQIGIRDEAINIDIENIIISHNGILDSGLRLYLKKIRKI